MEIGTDYLLGISGQNAVGKGDCEIQHRIGENLRNSLEPLEIIFGIELMSLFMDEKYVGEIKREENFELVLKEGES